MMCDFLKQDGLSLDILEHLFFQSHLGRSLKNSLGHFERFHILTEVEIAIWWYDEKVLLYELPLDCRVKSFQSATHKYERYYPNRPAAKVFDDLLGFRSLCDNYEGILTAKSMPRMRVADMSKGKAEDDGYRGVHVYYQKDNFHYPIEIQYNSYFDRQMNNWLHKYTYKKNHSCAVGAELRQLYEQGAIRNEEEFREAMKNVLCCCEEC